MDLPTQRYGVVVMDPPWPMSKTPRRTRPDQVDMDYKVMSLDDIAAMDIPAVLEDDAFVFVWTTQKYLPATWDIVTNWGLKYRFLMTWHKSGGFQIYNYPQFNSEFVVAATKGNPRFRDTKAFNTTFSAPRAPRPSHSVKPREFYDVIERVTDGPRLDMFARRVIPGFDGWGDEYPGGEGA